MKLKDTMIVWTPDRAPFLNYPLRGRVHAVEIPEPKFTTNHPCSYGASNLDWKEGTHEYRLKALQKLVDRKKAEDGISPHSIESALAEIDDLQAEQISV